MAGIRYEDQVEGPPPPPELRPCGSGAGRAGPRDVTGEGQNIGGHRPVVLVHNPEPCISKGSRDWQVTLLSYMAMEHIRHITYVLQRKLSGEGAPL